MPIAPDLVTRCRPLLGTFVEITVPEGHGGAVDRAFAIVAHIHARMSFHDEASDLVAIRRAAPGDPIVVDPDTVSVLRMATNLFDVTGGLFDVAIGRSLVAGGFLPRGDIGSLAKFDGTSVDIVIEGDDRIHLVRRALIDLGGIAKGYAVDRAVELLSELGVPCGLVNAGGDLRAFGPETWTIGLRDADDVLRESLDVRGFAVASSANLLNRRLRRGRLFTPHIGRAGRPVLSAERTTVIADKCAIADAMTKVAMVDPELADALLTQFKGHVVRSARTGEAL